MLELGLQGPVGISREAAGTGRYQPQGNKESRAFGALNTVLV